MTWWGDCSWPGGQGTGVTCCLGDIHRQAEKSSCFSNSMLILLKERNLCIAISNDILFTTDVQKESDMKSLCFQTEVAKMEGEWGGEEWHDGGREASFE